MKRFFNIFQLIVCFLSLIIVFIFDLLWLQISIFLLFIFFALLSKKRKDILKMFFHLSILLVFTLLVHLFFRFGDANYWQGFISIDIWTKTLFYTFRNANIILIMSYAIKSRNNLNMETLTGFLENRKPTKLFQPLSLASRYTGLIGEEFKSIQQVHRILGIQKPKHIIAQVKYYISLILPTIISSLERAEHLSIAMTSRGYNRTK